MRNVRIFSVTIVGLAVLLAFVPGGRASAQLLGLKAKFSYSPAYPVAGQEVQFIDESDGNPTFWEWKFDDGTTSPQKNPKHVFRDGGS